MFEMIGIDITIEETEIQKQPILVDSGVMWHYDICPEPDCTGEMELTDEWRERMPGSIFVDCEEWRCSECRYMESNEPDYDC